MAPSLTAEQQAAILQSGGSSRDDDNITVQRAQAQNLSQLVQALGDTGGDNVTALGLIVTAINSLTTAFTTFLGVGGTAGTFTMDADASTTVADANVTASSLIFITPTNASAATLVSGSSGPYVTNRVAGVSFDVDTADAGSAAGTETFNYLIINL